MCLFLSVLLSCKRSSSYNLAPAIRSKLPTAEFFLQVKKALLLGARTLLGAPSIATRTKDATRNKKLLGLMTYGTQR